MRGARPQHLSQDDADGQAAWGYPGCFPRAVDAAARQPQPAGCRLLRPGWPRSPSPHNRGRAFHHARGSIVVQRRPSFSQRRHQPPLRLTPAPPGPARRRSPPRRYRPQLELITVLGKAARNSATAVAGSLGQRRRLISRRPERPLRPSPLCRPVQPLSQSAPVRLRNRVSPHASVPKALR